MDKIIVENLSHTYIDGSKKKNVLKNINIEFETEKFYCILGESGSGKTTLLSLLAGLDKIQLGAIKYNNKTIKEIGETNYRLNHVNTIFQAYNLISYMTAVENVLVAIDMVKYKKNGKTRKEYAYNLLEKVGIHEDDANRRILKLSGGEQQRVAIARALAQEVQFIMADEPSGNLDDETEAKIIEVFKQLKKEGKGIIVVTHSKNVAKYADQVYKIQNGKLII